MVTPRAEPRRLRALDLKTIAPGDAATHAALRRLFGPHLQMAQLDGRWLALP